MSRNISIDICKGLAILFVYLGHSILYYPVNLGDVFWCNVLATCITSFNMPLFFVISVFLFVGTKKSSRELYKNKLIKIAIPFIFTMAIVICAKMLIPSSLSYNKLNSIGEGVRDVFLYGGDRWFVYVILIIFMGMIPLREKIMGWLGYIVLIACVILSMFKILPHIFLIDKVVLYLPFFLIGGILKSNFSFLQKFITKYSWIIYVVFGVCNVCLVRSLIVIPFVGNYVLAVIGCCNFIAISERIARYTESIVLKVIRYMGKYSLQFYLFTFPYPIIRYIITNVLGVTNSVVIVMSVFILQIVTIGVIVELGKRIKFLKIPMGY